MRIRHYHPYAWHSVLLSLDATETNWTLAQNAPLVSVSAYEVEKYLPKREESSCQHSSHEGGTCILGAHTDSVDVQKWTVTTLMVRCDSGI